MASKLRIFLPIIVPLLVSPTLAADLTYKEYAKASEIWKRGFVFGISRYIAAVAQPDEEPPYPVRTAFQRCLGNSTDSVLVQQVEGYVKAHPDHSNGPMTTVVVKLSLICGAPKSLKLEHPRPCRARGKAPGLCLPSIRSRVHEYAMRRIRSLGCRAPRQQPRRHIAAKQRDELAALLLRSQFCLI